MQPKILVIGSKGHDRADCVDWLQPFPNIEEYDSIVINLQSLTQDVYTKIQTKIRGMKESITTVFHTDREIFCIMNKVINPIPSPGGPKIKYITNTNYDWFPIKIKVDNRKKGRSINLYDNGFDRYFEYVDRWNFEISIPIGTTKRDMIILLLFGIVPIATNKSRKTIAGSLKGRDLAGKMQGKGAIHLLPPPTKCDPHQAVEIILGLICGEESKIVPVWRKDIEVPKIKEFEQDIEHNIIDIKRIQQEISQLERQIQEWDSYRDLLTATGYKLERIVQKALSDIGIKTEKTEKGFPADLISDKIVIEITGVKGCVRVDSEKVIQLARFKENYHKGEQIVLIVNTHMNLSPKDRESKMSFSREVKKFFDSISVCYLTSKTLFELWKDVVSEKKTKKDVIKKILTTSGELTL